MHPVTIHAGIHDRSDKQNICGRSPTGQRMHERGCIPGSNHISRMPFSPSHCHTSRLVLLCHAGLPVGCVLLQLVTCLVGALAKPTATEHETQPLTPALAAQLLQASIKPRRDRFGASMHAASKPAQKPLVVLHAAAAMQVIRAATRVGNSGECVEAESQIGRGTTSSGSLTGPGF